MEDNPYMVIISAMRNDIKSKAPVAYRYGTVKTNAPLSVEVSGLLHTESALLKNSLITSFSAGDRLLLMPIEDEQRYIILCKVVGV